jgi:hypothetical protein
MLHRLAENLWHAPHSFIAAGVPISTRMTVIRLPGDQLWLHSPIPIDAAMRAALEALGAVRYIVAPSKTHHLFVPSCIAAFPEAALYGAPGLRAKRPDLVTMLDLPAPESAPWASSLRHLVVGGIPHGNETVWFHESSATLIVADLLQWWQGDLPWQARCYAKLTGVRNQLAVPRTVRALVRDRDAVRHSAAEILRWPFARVITAHNAIVETEAQRSVRAAFKLWT